MGYSKTFLLLGLVFAVVLFISSHVSARDLLAEPAQNEEMVKTEDEHDHEHHHHDHDDHDHHHHHDHDHDHDDKHHGGSPPGHDEIGEKVETDSVGEAKREHRRRRRHGDHSGHD
ncbi:uncharacterized protein LOC132176704 [Corylus avellana]|uniref:uncharacterized protein LOC132176704 n=1 Tax=Corylus avellana TaxID=13451 RepID=UPI00286D2FFE|nr:uncharacterized protein LOC132176704 [Corylus avellana]